MSDLPNWWRSGRFAIAPSRLDGRIGGAEPRACIHPPGDHAPFVEVRYANEYPEIDFFTSIGTLARSKLASFWYAGPNGARSPAAEIVLSENEEWRSGYWRSHALTTTTKLPQWSREREHRLVLTTNFVRHGDAGSRKLRYRFGDLAGVAFGAKMAHADKLKIMRIIDRKAAAEGRSDFEFYQAGYEGRAGEVVCIV